MFKLFFLIIIQLLLKLLMVLVILLTWKLLVLFLLFGYLIWFCVYLWRFIIIAESRFFMFIFNFSFHKCCLCGNITDDGCFCVGSEWFCLDCLDLLSDIDVPF